jgi:3',5'-cyclic AMP phosphodiesterase CpdA
MRVAHISDLHISSRHHRRNIRNARRLLEYIDRLGVDHLVITGDITADARPQELELARNLLLSFGFLNSRRLSIVPGNHDIYGGVHEAEEILTFPRRIRETDYDGGLEAFRAAFAEAFEGVRTAGASAFPFSRFVGDTVIVGLNSIARYSRVKNAFGSNGHVGDGQKAAVAALIAQPEVCGRARIVLIHHHFHKLRSSSAGAVHSVWGAIERQTMKLRGKKDLLKLFARSDVSLVLHGHYHEMRDYTRGGIRFLNAGGSTLGPEDGDLLVNVADVTVDGCSVEVHRVSRPAPRIPVSMVVTPALSPSPAVSHRAA